MIQITEIILNVNEENDSGRHRRSDRGLCNKFLAVGITSQIVINAVNQQKEEIVILKGLKSELLKRKEFIVSRGMI